MALFGSSTSTKSMCGLTAARPKLRLEPQVRVGASFGFDAGTLRELVEVAQANRELIERTWHDTFG